MLSRNCLFFFIQLFAFSLGFCFSVFCLVGIWHYVTHYVTFVTLKQLSFKYSLSVLCSLDLRIRNNVLCIIKCVISVLCSNFLCSVYLKC